LGLNVRFGGQTALKAAQESIVLLKNDGALPLKSARAHIAVIGPTADLLPSILGKSVGTPVHPVTPLDGMRQQFKTSPILYAQGSIDPAHPDFMPIQILPIARSQYDRRLLSSK
jgi:hypothetical protein